ncbi:MAG: DUF3455 domain-containing protein [Polyangiaceae bacterium]|jgi:hypothetical protein
MKRYLIVPFMVAATGCSSSNEAGTDSGPSTDATGNDGNAVVEDSSSPAVDTGTATTPDTGALADTGSSQDTGAPQDGGTTDSGDAAASDGACPAAWMVAPIVDPSITVPDGGGGVLLHASGAGTQNYVCAQSTVDGGGTEYLWTLVTPQATLSDCNGAPIGHHFASEAGATAPEWQTTDGTYVVGHRIGAFTPDGGAGSIAWFLLQGTEHGGTGTLSNAQYIQRLFTDGGVAPASSCDEAAVGMTLNVPYGADYFFFGQ